MTEQPIVSPQAAAAAQRSTAFWLLAASLLVLAFALVTQAGRLAEGAQLAQGSKALRTAVLLRQRAGDLPLAQGAPGIYALGRAAGEDSGAVRGVEVDQALRRAAAALQGRAGGERLAGIALGSLGQYAAAAQQLQAAAPGDPFAALALGNVLDEQGQLDAARALWQPYNAQRALSLQLYRAGAALANQGQRSQGEAMLLRAIHIDPGNGNALHALGGFYWGEDRARSLEMYQAALATGALEPFFERFASGRIAFMEDRLEDAALALEDAVRLQPDHSDAVVLLGTTLSRLGRLSEAIDYLEDAAQRSPRAFWPLIELGRIYLDLGDYDQAITTLTAAAGRRADVARTFELLAEAYGRAGQPQQAISAWQQAIAVSPGNSVYHTRLGDALREDGQIDQAIASYRQALQLNPSNTAARDELLMLGEEP